MASASWVFCTLLQRCSQGTESGELFIWGLHGLGKQRGNGLGEVPEAARAEATGAAVEFAGERIPVVGELDEEIGGADAEGRAEVNAFYFQVRREVWGFGGLEDLEGGADLQRRAVGASQGVANFI